MSHRPAPAARRWLIVPSTIGWLVACSCLPAAGQAMTTTVTQPFLGVTHTHIETTNPRRLDMHLVAIDLGVPGIGFAVTPSNGAATGETVGRTTRQFLGDQKVQLAINGGFSAWVSGSNYDVQGLAASKGEIYSSFEQYRTFALDISADNVATILRSPSGTGTAHYPDIPLYNTLPGEARLLRDGSIVAPTANETLHPRTGVGLSGDQRTLYLFTVDGRNDGHSLGVTRPELADFMRMFGATDAINLDGGGSTTLVFADPVARLVNVPVGINDVPGTECVVGSNFGVFALPMPAPAAITLNVTSGTQTQWQAGQPLLVNALSLTKTGTGTLLLDQANTFTGSTTLIAGTVRLANARGLAASPVTIRSGATLAAAPGVRPCIPSVVLTGGVLDVADLTLGGTAGVGAVDGLERLDRSDGGHLAAHRRAALAAGDGSTRVCVFVAHCRPVAGRRPARHRHERGHGARRGNDDGRSRGRHRRGSRLCERHRGHRLVGSPGQPADRLAGCGRRLTLLRAGGRR